MKREEAKQWILEHMPPDDDTKQSQVMAVVIKALSQEPCDDTVSIRKDVLKCRVGKLVVYNVEWLKKHWQMEMDIVCGVKPCDDAVSREKVLEMITDFATLELYIDKHNHVTFEPLEKLIKSLPSVTQKSETVTEFADRCRECGKMRKGHWIYDETIENWRCSKCNETPKTMGYVGTADFMAEHFKFCNHCGAKTMCLNR